MINLNSIEIEGFGSVITPIKYKLGNPGLNKIEGPNGAGKTTITNALAWVCWGQLVKPKKSSIIPWPHVITKDYIGTRVLLKFDDGKDKYRLIRCNEYTGKVMGQTGKNRIFILKNGEELKGDGLRDKKDYQKWIIKKLGYSFELFKSTVMFTQELDNLMQEDGPSRKKIFDEAFETIFVNIAKQKVVDRLEKNEGSIKDLEYKLKINYAKLNGKKQLIKSQKKNIKNWESFKNERIEDEQKIIDVLKGRLNDLPKASKKRIDRLGNSLEGAGSLKDLEFKLTMELSGLSDESEQINLELIALRKGGKKICPRCGNSMSRRKVLKRIDELVAKKKSIDLEWKTKKTQRDGITDKLDSFKVIVKEITELRTRVKNIQDLSENIKIHEEILTNIRNEKPLKSELPELREAVKVFRNAISTQRQERKDLLGKIKIDKWLIKDPLSNSGLKAFIFDSMLGRVNNYLKSYTPVIGFGVKVFIDMSSANKDIRISIGKGGDEVPYEDLSKGQKQLTHVALAFSLSDTVQSIKPINCLFLDELFESLNTANIEKVSNIIIQKAKTKCVHLITHQTAFNPPNCNTTYVELDNQGHTHLN